jgi:hypothetical protein
MLLMEVQAVRLITLVILKGTSLLSCGMSQDMNATKNAAQFSIRRLTVHVVSPVY